jgi:hypothetical protein
MKVVSDRAGSLAYATVTQLASDGVVRQLSLTQAERALSCAMTMSPSVSFAA